MFFFIGGVQPKTKTLDPTPRICPACGLAQARLKRVDHYISLFFIPIFPVKKGEPVLMCDRCKAVSSPGGPEAPAGAAFAGPKCARCGYPAEPGFRYCPGCGAKL